ncbi:MAG: copper amine oxidase N-terminal domain-containing protein [Bacillota bacterium]
MIRIVLNKILSLVMIAALLTMSSLSPAMAQGGAGEPSMEKLEAALKPVIEESVKSCLEQVLPEVEDIVVAEIEAMAPKIISIAQVHKEQVDLIKDSARAHISKMLSGLPPEELISNIPPQLLGQLSTNAQNEAREIIISQFASVAPSVREQGSSAVEKQIPEIMEMVTASIQKTAPRINSIIEDSIKNNIQPEIQEKLIAQSQATFGNMQSEEIASRMFQRMRPDIESRFRPYVEERMKKKVNEAVLARIEKPIEEMVLSWSSAVVDSLLEETLSMLPEHVKRVIPESYIRSVVNEENKKIETLIANIIKEETSRISDKIYVLIDRELKKQIKVYNGDIRIIFDVAPQIKNERLLVPFRSIAESLGANVGWNGEKQQVIFSKGDKDIVLTLDSNTVIVNGKSVKIDVPPTVIEGRTMVPVRFLGEYLDMNVKWQPDWQMVTLEKK